MLMFVWCNRYLLWLIGNYNMLWQWQLNINYALYIKLNHNSFVKTIKNDSRQCTNMIYKNQAYFLRPQFQTRMLTILPDSIIVMGMKVQNYLIHWISWMMLKNYNCYCLVWESKGALEKSTVFYENGFHYGISAINELLYNWKYSW